MKVYLVGTSDCESTNTRYVCLSKETAQKRWEEIVNIDVCNAFYTLIKNKYQTYGGLSPHIFNGSNFTCATLVYFCTVALMFVIFLYHFHNPIIFTPFSNRVITNIVMTANGCKCFMFSKNFQ